MSKIIFEPWIGSKFASGNRFGLRVLVLGESHYGIESETRSSITIEVVRELAQDQRRAFFTKVSKLLLGLGGRTWIDDEARGEIWEHIAFYNYIQGFVSTDPRVRPSPGMWAAAQAPFLEVLKMYKPNVVLVLGKDLATHLPSMPKSVEICSIQHPSTGFSYEKWNPVFRAAVKRAKARS